MKDSRGVKYKGVGTETILPPFNTAQPHGVEGKGVSEAPRFHDNQLPTPYFGGKGEGPYVSMEVCFPPQKTSSSG